MYSYGNYDTAFYNLVWRGSLCICIYKFLFEQLQNRHSVAVQIEIYFDSGKFAVEHCEAK